MRQLLRWSACAALAVAAASFAPAAKAAVTADTGNIEVFVGWYSPDEDVKGQDLADLTWGLRGGFDFTKHFMLQFGGQEFSTNYDTVPGQVDIDQWMFDVSAGWNVNPDAKAVFSVYGGPGWASTDVDYPVLKDTSDSSFTAHLGLGLRVQIANRFYMRPDVRWRWIDGDNKTDDRNDWEATLGFGWTLGDIPQH